MKKILSILALLLLCELVLSSSKKDTESMESSKQELVFKKHKEIYDAYAGKDIDQLMKLSELKNKALATSMKVSVEVFNKDARTYFEADLGAVNSLKAYDRSSLKIEELGGNKYKVTVSGNLGGIVLVDSTGSDPVNIEIETIFVVKDGAATWVN